MADELIVPSKEVSKQEQKNKNNNFYLTIKESNSDICKEYIDYFNRDSLLFNSPESSRWNFHYRNVETGYDYCKSKESKGCLFEQVKWKSLSYLEGNDPTLFTDLVEEVITGDKIDKKRASRKAFDRIPSSPVILFESNVDIDGDGNAEHLLRYQNDEFYNKRGHPNNFKNVVFSVEENPFYFNIEKNRSFFPRIYEKDFLCAPEYMRSDIASINFTSGQDQWLFKYKDKFYFDFTSSTTRSIETCKTYKKFNEYGLSSFLDIKTNEIQTGECMKLYQHDKPRRDACKTSNFEEKYDLSSIVFIHEVSSQKPACILKINDKQENVKINGVRLD